MFVCMLQQHARSVIVVSEVLPLHIIQEQLVDVAVLTWTVFSLLYVLQLTPPHVVTHVCMYLYADVLLSECGENA